MSKFYSVLSLFGLAAAGAALLGCSKESAAPPATEEKVVDAVEVPALETGETSEALAGLSEADRAAVLAQKVCPVSGEALGEMGPPIKVTVKGRDVFLCCEGCRGKIEANPDEYLAKLDANAKLDAK